MKGKGRRGTGSNAPSPRRPARRGGGGARLGQGARVWKWPGVGEEGPGRAEGRALGSGEADGPRGREARLTPRRDGPQGGRTEQGGAAWWGPFACAAAAARWDSRRAWPAIAAFEARATSRGRRARTDGGGEEGASERGRRGRWRTTERGAAGRGVKPGSRSSGRVGAPPSGRIPESQAGDGRR